MILFNDFFVNLVNSKAKIPDKENKAEKIRRT